MPFPTQHTSRRLGTYLLLVTLCFWWLPFSFSKQTTNKPQSQGDLVNTLLEHVEDHHQLHFGKVHLSLPVIVYKKGQGWAVFSSHHFYGKHQKPVAYRGFRLENNHIVAQDGQAVYDFSITKNVASMLLVALMMCLFFIALARYMRRQASQKKTPRGIWVVPLSCIRFVRDIAREHIGREHYERFTPYLLTLFFYILFCNLLGLLPEGANVTGNISVTLALAMLTFLITHWNASRDYWHHLFKPSVPIFIMPLVVFIEVVSTLLRPIILALRLLANILSGHIVILCLLSIIFILKNIFAPIVIVPLTAGMVMLKIFVAVIQAYVFTLLTAISFGTAIKTHKDHGA